MRKIWSATCREEWFLKRSLMVMYVGLQITVSSCSPNSFEAAFTSSWLRNKAARLFGKTTATLVMSLPNRFMRFSATSWMYVFAFIEGTCLEFWALNAGVLLAGSRGVSFLSFDQVERYQAGQWCRGLAAGVLLAGSRGVGGCLYFAFISFIFPGTIAQRKP